MNLSPKKLYTISELERESGIRQRTIHYYIRLGLLQPPYGRGRGARYSDMHLARLMRIRRLKELGMTLGQIQEILETLSDHEIDRLIEEKIFQQRHQTTQRFIKETWERFVIEEGLEIYVRHPVREETKKRLEALVDLLKPVS